MTLKNLLKNSSLRTKMFFIVLPLVVIPMILVGNIIGYFSVQQVRQGITQASKNDLE